MSLTFLNFRAVQTPFESFTLFSCRISVNVTSLVYSPFQLRETP